MLSMSRSRAVDGNVSAARFQGLTVAGV